MYQSRHGPLRKDELPKAKLTMSTTKATLMSKEIADIKMKKRQEDPFEKHRNMFKMKKFKEVNGKVSTNREAFSHHKKARSQSQNPQCANKQASEQPGAPCGQPGYDQPVPAS